ncbi:methyltransferase domain-containing protein [Lutibaculum baratangense]|uniref:Methyltransferase domain-containing protein n=1 Tax=Lutibaculum baratangense AMV1 TaxID=631454 RepID=V4RC18_9HYPH|nr:methyltransferase domain-containing protein [Lutibaculum baratangense]ESR22904.1 hypothetical protein N177_4041 [Lutibaculum baratangense AMV1]
MDGRRGTFSEFSAAWQRRDLDQWIAIADRLERSDPFLFSYVADIVAHFRTVAGRDDRSGRAWLRKLRRRVLAVPPEPSLERAQAALEQRATFFDNWRQEGNDTIAALRGSRLPLASVRPHVRNPASSYDEFYENDDRNTKPVRQETNAHTSFRPVQLPPNINHSFRIPLALTHVEVLFALAGALNGKPSTSWIDVACGPGTITNGVDPGRFGDGEWGIVGTDLQAAKIAIANARRTRGRSFFAEDALQRLRERHEAGERFDIISMFEFLEHLEDPLAFLKQVAAFEPMFVIAASPREQVFNLPFDAAPDVQHLWSFSRAGWERMFEIAGLTPVYASESLVGHYIGGLDWLTMIAGPKDVMRRVRMDYRKAAS